MNESEIRRKQEHNAKRMESIKGASVVHASSSINIQKFKTDNSKAAEHARRWGAMKPYYLRDK